jgi:hypothetical protein
MTRTQARHAAFAELKTAHPSVKSRSRLTTRPATSGSGRRLDMGNAIVRRLFSAGLSVESAAGLASGSLARRLEQAGAGDEGGRLSPPRDQG